MSKLKNDRFKEVYCALRTSELVTRTHRDSVFKDEVTGVLYLQTTNENGVSVIPLIDRDGKPLVE